MCDLLINVKLPVVSKSDISRRFEFLWQNCQSAIMRTLCLALMTCPLMLFRCFCSQYKLPNFTPEENPVAAHPSLFVRVSPSESNFLTIFNISMSCEFEFQFFSSIYVHALDLWLLICPDWLCCDWSHGSLPFIETWTDYRIVFALVVYIFLIRAFIMGPR